MRADKAPAPALFANYLKASQGKLTYGHDGSGGTMQLAAERLFDRLGARLRGVPFGGAGETAAALLAGRVDIYGGSIPPILSHVASGKMKCPLLTSAGKNPALPGSLGLDALGLGADETVLWWGLLAPRDITADKLARLERAFVAAAQSPAFQKLLGRKGAISRAIGARETSAMIRLEYRALAGISKAVALRR